MSSAKLQPYRAGSDRTATKARRHEASGFLRVLVSRWPIGTSRMFLFRARRRVPVRDVLPVTPGARLVDPGAGVEDLFGALRLRGAGGFPRGVLQRLGARH